MRRFDDIEQVREAIGEDLGATEWLEIAQDRVDAFAAATGDHNKIHVDPAHAATTPFGGTIAHGLLTLSLGPAFTYELADFSPLGENLNYGYEKVRFPAPLPVGSRVRMRLAIGAVEEVSGGLRLLLLETFEREGEQRPVCVAEGVLYALSA